MGYSIKRATQECGMSYATGRSWETDTPRNGQEFRSSHEADQQGDVVHPVNYCPEAVRALDDFGYFRWRYFRRASTPWQEEAGHRIVDLLETPDREFVVLNCPPGSGKSTTFVHDLPIWLIVRNRAIRQLLGHAVQRLATQYTLRVRRSLDRTRPLAAEDASLAEGVLGIDFGRFRPTVSDLWRAEEFVVAQFSEDGIEDKEPTVSAFGMETESIGHRANFIAWDDLVTKRILRNAESIDNQRSWWTDIAEKRVEPGGLVLLQGQRLGPEDLYRFCLDMTDDLEELDGVDEDATPRKYHHIVYPAHREDQCKGEHGGRGKPDPEAWPDGCLLDPHRLPWRDLRREQKNNESGYRTVYQQEDVDPGQVLVPLLWIRGGVDPETSEHFPGCEDQDRDLCELPPGLKQPLYSVATADPSPTNFWAIEWWIYSPASNQRFLMDLERRRMDAPDFLDWNHYNNSFYGLMHEWQLRSIQLGWPITSWIVEVNAAQRFLLQYDHTHRWRRKYGVSVIAHTTGLNKSNPDYGVQMLKNVYRFGQVRLPMKQRTVAMARTASMKLVDEVTRYPQARYDDCLMAQWFFEFNLQKGIVGREEVEEITVARPSWMRGKKRVAA